jgi:transposase InsO family protein
MSTIEGDTASGPVSSPPIGSNNRRITMTSDNRLPETYHLEGGANFGVWAYMMMNLLQKDGRFHYCLTPPSEIMGEEEKMAWQQVLSTINSNAKNTALKLLQRYKDPYECWTGLKTRYESDSGPRQVNLIEKFFALWKTKSISMDDHLTEVKEIANLLEEVEVNIPEDIIVYYTLKNLPKEYEIFRRMQIASQTLPTYEQLEAKLISEETSIKMENLQKENGEAFFSYQDQHRRPQSTPKYNHFTTSQHPSRRFADPSRHFADPSRRFADSGGFSTNRSPSQAEAGGSSTTRYQHQTPTPKFQHSGSTQRSSTQPIYQPRYRTRGPDKPRNDKCNFCGLEGHFERECDVRSILDRMKDYEHRLLQQRNRNLNGQVHHLEEPIDLFKQDHDPNNFELADQVVDACLLELNLLDSPSQTTLWYLDSGATHHVSGDSSAFSSIYPSAGTHVRSAGGQNHNVTGVGNADILFSSGEIKSVSSILYTPGITKNLLSVGSLTDQHKTLVFRSNGCFVINNHTHKVEVFAPRENGKGLYRLTGTQPNAGPEANLIHSNSHSALWHKRLGHFHTKGIQRMIHHKAVRGLPQLRFPKQICNGCQFGKHARTKLPKETRHHASRPLELVHSDVCGPFRVNSLGGSRFFVPFIDDFSRKLWTYFITNKSQVLTKFQHFVHLMETSTGRTVQMLRIDNGGEYTSKVFSDFCSSKGISHELTPPYTPQRNGIAERRNRSLLDITRCLLIDKQLPGNLWGEAVKATADILNLCSTKRHPDKTLEELFNGKKPSISHLRIFGSPAFAHIPKTSRSKLDPRSEKVVLLSFDEGAKAYRCYKPSTKRVFVSRDLFNDETAMLTTDPSPAPKEYTADSYTPAPTRTEELKIV